jgi:MIP family channel proteins
MNQVLRASIGEMAGTFTLTFIGGGAIIAGQGGLTGIALAHGLALAMAVYYTQGGHINPAVTIAMLATRRIQLPAALSYIGFQLVGAVLAAFALKQFFPEEMVAAAKLGATLSGDPMMDKLGLVKVALIEAVLTFFLVMTIFAVAVDRRGAKNVYGFAIGLTICMDILAGGPLTGASMNPARSFGPALIGGYWKFHSAYWLGPILGGLIAAIFYEAFLLPDDQKVKPGA